MSSDPNIEFAKEQYVQYWEMKRMHLSFSWQIPALAIVAVLAIIGIDPEKIPKLGNIPLVSALIFLALGLFAITMFVHHCRNRLFASRYDKILAELEKRFGVEVKIHHFQLESDFRWWQRMSSSWALSTFLVLLSAGLLVASLYFFYKVIL